MLSLFHAYVRLFLVLLATIQRTPLPTCATAGQERGRQLRRPQINYCPRPMLHSQWPTLLHHHFLGGSHGGCALAMWVPTNKMTAVPAITIESLCIDFPPRRSNEAREGSASFCEVAMRLAVALPYLEARGFVAATIQRTPLPPCMGRTNSVHRPRSVLTPFFGSRHSCAGARQCRKQQPSDS